jgi:3-hydroxyacyl-[acyl-carrier-protein] dehydratase
MVSDNEFTGTFFFDPSDKIYKGHFPGNPVVPGSLLINGFNTIIRNNFSDNGTLLAANFRFRKFLKPGRYSFSVIPLKSAYKCVLFLDGKTMVTGEIKKVAT